MIEERGRVCAVAEGFVWVEIKRQSNCSACLANKGCGAAVLTQILGRRRVRLRALAQILLRPGDEVIIGIGEHALLEGALAVYMAPLLALLLGAIAGEWVFGGGEGAAVLGGVLGLLAAFAWLGAYTRRIRNDDRFQAVVLHRLASADPRSVSS